MLGLWIERKEKCTLFSDHNGSLLRRQPGAMTIGFCQEKEGMQEQYYKKDV